MEYAVLLTMEQNKIREKLREIMEEQIGMLKSSREEPLSISEAPPPSDTDQRAETKSKGGEQQEEEDKLQGGDNNAAARATHEDKADMLKAKTEEGEDGNTSK
ncbi:uncharacterized protein LOC110764728 [Prunus avium]|uniref:Uncharacterized protein LOC110764728 n=1 Tax=Prunus avium TaxID=42229 RepID=A0A6P5T8G3_PRUAV|nr:uncharacterized protein LOC110764728 [Prunus avium]